MHNQLSQANSKSRSPKICTLKNSGTDFNRQKSITPTKITKIDISNNSKNNNNATKVRFQKSPIISKDNLDLKTDRSDKVKSKINVAGYSKQPSIEGENSIFYNDVSMNAYYGTLNQIKMDRDSQTSIPHHNFNSHAHSKVQTAKLENKNAQTNTNKNTINSITSVKQSNKNGTNPINFDKMHNRDEGKMFQQWGQSQQLGKWESKIISPQKQVQRIATETTPVSSTKNRCSSRSSSQRQRDFVSQIWTLPGSETQKALSEQNRLGLLSRKIQLNDQSPSFKQQDDRPRSRSKNQNDTNHIISLLQTPKNADSEQNQQVAQPNLFSKYLKQQQQYKDIAESQYVSCYKQEYSMKINEKDVSQQESQQRKKQEEAQRRQRNHLNESEIKTKTIVLTKSRDGTNYNIREKSNENNNNNNNNNKSYNNNISQSVQLERRTSGKQNNEQQKYQYKENRLVLTNPEQYYYSNTNLSSSINQNKASTVMNEMQTPQRLHQSHTYIKISL